MTVVITARDAERIVTKHMKTATRRIVGFDRIYRCYDNCHYDFIATTLDGTMLTEARSFANHDDAESWIEEDDRQRRLLHSARVYA
jgi:hypothetical protein